MARLASWPVSNVYTSRVATRGGEDADSSRDGAMVRGMIDISGGEKSTLHTLLLFHIAADRLLMDAVTAPAHLPSHAVLLGKPHEPDVLPYIGKPITVAAKVNH